MQLEHAETAGTNIHRDTLLKSIVILFISGVITILALSRFWAAHVNLMHTSAELVSIFLLIAAFVDTWHTFDEVSSLNRLIGFSFLVIAVMNVMHVLLFINLISLGTNNVDISIKFWYPSGFFEVILLYLVVSARIRINVGKWIALLISFALCLLFVVFIYSAFLVAPALYDSTGITRSKHIMDIILFAATVLVIIKASITLQKNAAGFNDKTILINTYFALIMFAFSRVSFIFSNDISDMAYAYGHVLKIIYSFFLYSAVYKTTVKYPYEELKEINEENRIIINSATIGMINFDDSDRITLVNSKCEKLLNTAKDDLIGTGFKDFVEKYICMPAEGINNLEYVESLGENKEFTCLCNSGKGSPLKIIVTTVLMKHRKVLVLRDAKKQQALENMQLQTQTVLNAIESPVLVMDINNRIIMCNESYEKLVEMPADEVLGKSISELDDMVRFRAVKVSNVTKMGECYIGSLEADLTTISGKEKRVMINSSVIRNVDGEIIGFISVTPDITDMKKEQERIQQQEKLALLGQMAAGLVHEIKNPLTAVKGFIQMVKQKTENGKVQEYADVIDNAADDINRIVTDFLMFAKPLSVKKHDISINKLVKSLEIIVGSNAFKNDVASSFTYSQNERHVIADERQIKQVILNIVDNALYAVNSKERPAIKISTRYDSTADEMQICISDNGIGMNAEQLSKVGTPFYTTKEKGTGLGVSICNHIISEHEGSMSIESEYSKGTTFTIKLPCKSA